MANKILTVQQCNDMEERLLQYRSDVDESISRIVKMIDKFKSNEVVQSFYASGSFGKEMEDKIVDLKNKMLEFMDVIDSKSGSNSLFSSTRTFIRTQRELLNRGSGSGYNKEVIQ